jgi:hypothetical protein
MKLFGQPGRFAQVVARGGNEGEYPLGGLAGNRPNFIHAEAFDGMQDEGLARS